MSEKQKRFHFKKPPLSASIFALIGVGLLLSLGTWQAQKYVAKGSTRNADICTNELTPIYTDNFTALDQSPYARCLDKMALSGTLMESIQIPVGPRMHDDKMGYHLYIPLEGDDGNIILVNTGWATEPTQNISNTITAKNIQITGNLVRPSAPNYFTPDNNPAGNEWFSIKMDEIRARYPDLNNGNLADHVLIANALYPPGILPDFIPAAMARSFLTPQMHLQYAGFWYFMALALVGVFVFRFIIVRKNPAAE